MMEQPNLKGLEEKAKRLKERKKYQEEKDPYEEYEKEVTRMSGGLVTTNKAEFVKMVAFFNVVDHEYFEKLGKVIKKIGRS